MPALAGVRMPRPSIASVLLLAVLSSGCAGDVGRLLIDPAKFDYHTCAQLERIMQSNRVRAGEFRGLMERAAQDSVIVARVTYAPEYQATRSEMRLIEEVAQRKECDPPIVAAETSGTPALPFIAVPPSSGTAPARNR
jgi:hypothetical protein